MNSVLCKSRFATKNRASNSVPLGNQEKVSLKFLFIGLAVWSVLVGGCAPRLQAEPTQIPPPRATPTSSPEPTVETKGAPCALPTRWKIDFQRSGGFAGQTQSLKLSSAGDIQFVDMDTGRSSSKTLTTAELAGLQGALARACPFRIQKPISNCADCFSYMLAVEMDGMKFDVEANDASISSTLQPLVQLLSTYLQRMATPLEGGTSCLAIVF